MPEVKLHEKEKGLSQLSQQIIAWIQFSRIQLEPTQEALPRQATPHSLMQVGYLVDQSAGMRVYSPDDT